MPGIAAIISGNDQPRNERDIHAMTSAMMHESFYVSGTYSNAELGVHVGWACHPGSYCDCLPITNATRNLLLFFFGEHHAADDGSNGGCAPTARSLINDFEQDPVVAVSKLNGWFQGVLVDLSRRQVGVFNDRYGMQRLHVAEQPAGTLFASEAKALLRVRREFRTVDPRGLGELLSCGAVLENRTLFPQIRTMPGGSYWTFQDAKPARRRQYFTPASLESRPSLTEPKLEEKLRELMPRLARRYFRSNLPVAVSLTGGYDTRMIMANLGGEGRSGRAYTFGGPYRDCFDVKIARKVASACGFSHEVLRLDQPFFSSFPALAEKTVYISDGNLGACNAYELYLNTRARQIAPLKVTGSFGSEVMRGSRAFKAVDIGGKLVQPALREQIRQAMATFDEISVGRNLSFSVFKHAPWYYFNRLAVEQSQVVVRTPFLDNELVDLMYRAPIGAGDQRDLAIRLIRHRDAGLARLPTDTGNTSWLKQRVLHFFFQADYCYKSGMPQWLEQLHYVFGPLQPERFFIGLHRFQHFRVWFRTQLADYVKSVILDPRTLSRPYFNRTFLETMVTRHLKGDRNYTDDIERVLTVELMHRSLLETS